SARVGPPAAPDDSLHTTAEIALGKREKAAARKTDQPKPATLPQGVQVAGGSEPSGPFSAGAAFVAGAAWSKRATSSPRPLPAQANAARPSAEEQWLAQIRPN